MKVLTGTDWRGDSVFFVYDNAKKIMLARFDSLPDAIAFMASRRAA